MELSKAAYFHLFFSIFFINELIEQCCQLNLGATYEGENVSILVYADDILLISPVDKHLQDLLDKCTAFSEKWCVKFNPNKSNIIQFGKPLLSQYPLILNNKPLTFSNSLKYLGIEINNNFDPNITAIEKFKKVQKSIFSLSFLGLRPNKISPFLQSSIFKTFCLSQFTYALETTTLNQKTRNYLNICQNNLIRQLLKLNKFCHITEVLQCLRIHDFENLYICSKLSFLETIKNNGLSQFIFDRLCLDLNNTKKKSKSFKKDILLLEQYFGTDIAVILASPSRLKAEIKGTFRERDQLSETVFFCLKNFHIPFYKNFLSNIIMPSFLQEYIAQMDEIINS